MLQSDSGSFAVPHHIKISITMKFGSFLLLSSLLPLPMVVLNQQTAVAVVQPANSAAKTQLDELIAAGEKLLGKSEYSAALTKFQQGLVLAKKIGDQESAGIILNDIGTVYNYRGYYPKALEYFQQSLTISTSIGNIAVMGTALNNIGLVYDSLGQYSQALEYYQQSLLAKRAVGNKAGEGTTLNNIGSVYDSLGQYPQALEYYQQALAISRVLGDRDGEGANLNNIGVAYQYLGQYPKALAYFQKSLGIRKALGNKDGEATNLNNIGRVYHLLGQYPKALAYLEQALVISKAIGDKLGEGNTLSNIGGVYRSLGQYPKALAYLEQALVISKAIGNKTVEGNTLNNIGEVYNSLRQYSTALEYYQQSLIIKKAISNKNGEGITLTNIGATLLDQQKPALAEKPLRAAIAIWETIRGSKNTAGQGLSDSDKVSFANSVANTYKLLQKALVQQNKPQAALEVAERGRARALTELLAARLVNIKATAVPNLPPAPNLAKIQQIAKNQNATLVEYSLIDETIYIWVISPQGQIAFQQSQLPPNTNIPDLVNISRADIGVRGRSRASDSLASVAAAQGDLKLLHKLLIAPIAKSLPKDPTQRIIVIPQGELFFIPFVALQDSQGQYLIEQHTISTASSIGLLDSSSPPAKFNSKRGEILVVGNPIMPLAPDGTQLDPLPGAGAEAIAIGSILKTIPLIGAEADKNIVVNKMRSASIIHLATHGLLDRVRGDIPGAIALTNGLLTSNEIFDLKLQASLVVLSACDTGRGDLSGDGVIGLSRALAAAGTPSVGVSLWTVSDSATKELMVEFYQNWYGKGLDKAQAMRQAMLEVMKTHDKPSDWAAFTIMGEAR
jgi:CHAT domain-containing protein/lipoprotein NlpI